MYVSIEMKFEENWRILKSKYNIENHWSIVNYLKEELISRWKTRIIKCFINKMLSFDNIITSRDEIDHAQLKRVLRTFVEDLKKNNYSYWASSEEWKIEVSYCSRRSKDTLFYKL
jgi:hypothetical protein